MRYCQRPCKFQIIAELSAGGFSPGFVRDIPLPAGFARATFPAGSYMAWLSGLKLKSEPVVRTHAGEALPENRYSVFAVIDLPILFQEDLEQCADYCMRFWAEYHKASGNLDELFLFDYNGRKRLFRDSGLPFERYLRNSMAYSNSHSILKGGTPVADSDARPGDMFVQNETGRIGHVSMIVDMCAGAGGERLFLIGFSFMPAQEFHIEKAQEGFGLDGWFHLSGYRRFLAARYNFGEPHLRRF